MDKQKKKKSKPTAVIRCNKCHEQMLPDESQSNQNWKAYPMDHECKCGGIFKLEVIY